MCVNTAVAEEMLCIHLPQHCATEVQSAKHTTPSLVKQGPPTANCNNHPTGCLDTTTSSPDQQGAAGRGERERGVRLSATNSLLAIYLFSFSRRYFFKDANLDCSIHRNVHQRQWGCGVTAPGVCVGPQCFWCLWSGL